MVVVTILPLALSLALSATYLTQHKVDGPVLVSRDDEQQGPFPEKDSQGEDKMNSVATNEIQKLSAVEIMNGMEDGTTAPKSSDHDSALVFAIQSAAGTDVDSFPEESSDKAIDDMNEKTVDKQHPVKTVVDHYMSKGSLKETVPAITRMDNFNFEVALPQVVDGTPSMPERVEPHVNSKPSMPVSSMDERRMERSAEEETGMWTDTVFATSPGETWAPRAHNHGSWQPSNN